MAPRISSPVGSLEEFVLLLIFFSTSLYMYFAANTFSSSAALWPQILGAFVVIGAVLIIFQNYLPEPVRKLIAEDQGMIEIDDKIETDESEADPADDGTVAGVDDPETDNATEDPETDAKTSTVNRPIHDSLFTVLSAIGYIVVGYLFGLLWASPLYVALHTYWFRLKWYYILGLSIAAFLIAYTFMDLMFLRLDEGLLFEGI